MKIEANCLKPCMHARLGGWGWGWGGGWGGAGRGGLYDYIWHSMDVRAEWPPLSALPGI